MFAWPEVFSVLTDGGGTLLAVTWHMVPVDQSLEQTSWFSEFPWVQISLPTQPYECRLITSKL